MSGAVPSLHLIHSCRAEDELLTLYDIREGTVNEL